MLLFDLLKLWEPAFTPGHTKVHLARYNRENASPTCSWKAASTNGNPSEISRRSVVSLIQAGHPTRWLFAGLFRRKGRRDYLFITHRGEQLSNRSAPSKSMHP